jgi:hypothetical protein
VIEAQKAMERSPFMKKPIFALASILGFAFLLGGCDSSGSSSLPKVTLADAKDAWAAIGAVATKIYSDCIVDNGSASFDDRTRNDGSALFLEKLTAGGGFPKTTTYSMKVFLEQTSGYTFTGSIVSKQRSSTSGDEELDLSLSRLSKPVEKVKGILLSSNGSPGGTITFNDDEFQFSQLGGF